MEPQFLLSCLAGVEQLLSRRLFVLLGCPFPGPAQREQDFVGCLGPCSLVFQVASFFSYKLGYVKQKEKPGNPLLFSYLFQDP